MNIYKWFKSKNKWLQGGIIGILICLILIVFYSLIYFPIVNYFSGGMTPESALIPLFITGHAFPILSHFLIPEGLFCKFTEPTCTSWIAEKVPNSTPWTLETGEQGFCTDQIMTPTTACAEISGIIVSIGLLILLCAIYFAIGAKVGQSIQKNKSNK